MSTKTSGYSLAALVVAVAIAGCGSSSQKSPEALCERIFERRINGIHAPFRNNGPAHRDAFMKACPLLPMAYLECENRDALHQDRECRRIFTETPYQRQLSDILLSGWVGAKRQKRMAPQTGPPATAGTDAGAP